MPHWHVPSSQSGTVCSFPPTSPSPCQPLYSVFLLAGRPVWMGSGAQRQVDRIRARFPFAASHVILSSAQGGQRRKQGSPLRKCVDDRVLVSL